MNTRLAVAAFLVLFGLAGCASDRAGCARGMIAVPVLGESSIFWGGDEPVARAEITRVQAECYLVERLSDSRPTMAEIAVTATVTLEVFDEASERVLDSVFNPEFPQFAMFDALSASGVVLGSQQASIQLRRNSSEHMMSARISGLSPEAATLVEEVRVRWFSDDETLAEWLRIDGR